MFIMWHVPELQLSLQINQAISLENQRHSRFGI